MTRTLGDLNDRAPERRETFVHTVKVRLWIAETSILNVPVTGEYLIDRALRQLERHGSIEGWNFETVGVAELDLSLHNPTRGGR